jgi:hypothetical protein
LLSPLFSFVLVEACVPQRNADTDGGSPDAALDVAPPDADGPDADAGPDVIPTCPTGVCGCPTGPSCGGGPYPCGPLLTYSSPTCYTCCTNGACKANADCPPGFGCLTQFTGQSAATGNCVPLDQAADACGNAYCGYCACANPDAGDVTACDCVLPKEGYPCPHGKCDGTNVCVPLVPEVPDAGDASAATEATCARPCFDCVSGQSCCAIGDASVCVAPTRAPPGSSCSP